MRIVKLILLVLLIVMSLAAGVAKIMQTPQELSFFEAAGFTTKLLMPFGLAQVLGGLFAVNPRMRMIGLAIMVLAFLLSALMIFRTGDVQFGLISLLPAIFSALLLYSERKSYETL